MDVSKTAQRGLQPSGNSQTQRLGHVSVRLKGSLNGKGWTICWWYVGYCETQSIASDLLAIDSL